MTATEGQAAGLGLAIIASYIGAILFVLLRSAKARPVEDPIQPQGGRKRELMPARSLPDGFLGPGQPGVDGRQAEMRHHQSEGPKENRL